MPTPLSPQLDWALANPKWAQTLNPIVNNPILQGQIITGITLNSGTPKTINHGLGRMMIGWFAVDNQANANVWRTASFNTQTLTLEASATTTISLWCF